MAAARITRGKRFSGRSYAKLSPAATLLLLAASWALQPMMFTSSRLPQWGLQSLAGRAANIARRQQQAETDVGLQSIMPVGAMNVAALKQDIRKAPTEATIVALEKMRQPQDVLSDLSGLRGEWTLLRQQDGIRSWLSGDLSKLLLGLYSGRIGRALNMELLSSAELVVAPDGRADTRLRLRWGSRQDEVLLQSTVQVVAANKITEKPRAVRSSSLRITLPWLQRRRELRVTFYDGEFLVVRDQQGVGTVYVRHSAPVLPGREASSAEAMAAETENTMEESVEDLASKVESLRGALEAQQEQTALDRAERQRLQVEVTELERSLKEALAASGADALKLKAIEAVQGQVAQGVFDQRQKTEYEASVHKNLATEVASLQQQIAQREQDIRNLESQEASLRGQMKVLETELKSLSRENRQAYRTAVMKVREQLREARSQLRSARKTVPPLNRELAEKNKKLERQEEASSNQMATAEMIEAQLNERRQEQQAQAMALEKSTATEQALNKDLDSLREEVVALEARDEKNREFAAGAEVEMKRIVSQATETQKLAKSLKTGRRRFWPLR